MPLRYRPTRAVIRSLAVFCVLTLGFTALAWALDRPAPRLIVQLPIDEFFRRERITAMTYTPDGHFMLVATALQKRVGTYDATDTAGLTHVSVDTPGFLYLWWVEKGSTKPWGRQDSLFWREVHPSASRFATMLWRTDLRNSQGLPGLPKTGLPSTVKRIEFAPDGNRLAILGGDLVPRPD